MSPNTKIEEKTDELSSKNEPENTQVECLEYNLKIRCTKAADGSRCCEIQEIAVIEPKSDEPHTTEATDSTEKQDPVSPPTVPISASKEEANGKCSLCDALASAVKEKVRVSVPRQFHLSGRTRRMIRS